MAPLDLSKILKGYEGKWVALTDDNKSVLASGNTGKEAADHALDHGHTDFTLFYVQPADVLYCG